jgi:hypothetical protein
LNSGFTYRVAFLLAIACLALVINCSAQAISIDSTKLAATDSAVVVTDTTNTSAAKTDSLKLRLQFSTKNPIPKRSAMYSALLPGLGQIYNKQYSRLPIVYGGFTASAILFTGQYRKYRTFQQAYVYRTDNNPSTIDSFQVKGIYSAQDLLEQRNVARRNLDKIGVYTTVWYFLNIVDALVGAHLKTFDMSKSLSMQVQPSLNPQLIGVRATFQLHHTNQNEYCFNRIW